MIYGVRLGEVFPYPDAILALGTRDRASHSVARQASASDMHHDKRNDRNHDDEENLESNRHSIGGRPVNRIGNYEQAGRGHSTRCLILPQPA